MHRDLPLELVEQIFLRLPLSDLVRLTTLSTFYHDLIHHSHLLWTHHLQKSGLLGLSSDIQNSPNNLNKFKRLYGFVKELEETLETLSHDHLHSTIIEIDLETDQLQSYLQDPEKREIAYRHLSSLLHSSNKFTNLTQKLYARYFLVAQTQLGIIQDLASCLQTSSVFEGSLLVSRWVGASLGESSIIHNIKPTECIPVHETIESIVNQCRGLLVPSATIEAVLSVINRVLYQDFGLKKNVDNYYDVENNRVDRVLYKKTGIPITIAIIYHEVASRLGLTLSLVNFPRHFLLSFESSSGTTMYIDCFNEGNILSRGQCLGLCPISMIADKDCYFESTAPANVLERLIRNMNFAQVVHVSYNRAFFALNLYKLLSYLAPNDYESAVHAMNFSLDLRIKCNFLQKFSCIEPDVWSKYCRRVSQASESLKNQLRVKRSKPSHIKFNIGSVMLHKRYNYTCVLYGWDERCMMNEEWQVRMGIASLEFQGNQPYYRVLADDDSERYVAQENLLGTRSVFINHGDVGKYFSLYDGERFVPNSALKSVYTYLQKD
ncbi:hypothetical protein ACHWQZ_G010711 [Mnemiopsis leidyi]